MADAVFYFVCMAPIGMRHRQWLSEYSPLASGIATGKVAGVKYQGRTAVQELHTLYLAQTVAENCGWTPTTAGTHGTPSCCVGMEGNVRFITGHTVKAYMPSMTFFTHLWFYLGNYLLKSRFLCTFAPCRWALFLLWVHIQRYEKIHTSATL